MNTEEQFQKDIWWLLQELKKDEMSTPRSEHIHFEYSVSENKPTIDDQRRAVRFLKTTKSLNISKDIFPLTIDKLTAELSGIKPIGHFLELRQPTFNEIYKTIDWAVNEKNPQTPNSPQNPVHQKTSEQKLVCVLNVIKEEFELGTHSGWIDIPASDFSACGTDRDKLSRIISKFTNEKIIDKFIFIDGSEAKYEEEYEYDVYRLFLPTDFSKKADEFTLSVLDPRGYSELKELNNNFEDMRLHPEKYRKQSKERAEKRKKRTQKMYAEINYSDPIEKTAWELKWGLVQKLWLVYTSNGKEMTIRIPITELTRNMSVVEIRGILDGLKEEGCFNDWQTYQGNYDIYLIDDKTFGETYKQVKTACKTFSDTHEETNGSLRKKARAKKEDTKEPPIQKIIHEHTHLFKNSIQEKDIVLNHKYEKGDANTLYITKKNNDLYYKDKYLEVSKTAEYYQVFCALFAKLPTGGEISYKDLSKEIQSRIPKAKSKSDEEMRKFIQANLTDTSNGFVRYAKIPASEDSGKPLIEIIRGSGVRFNNKRE